MYKLIHKLTRMKPPSVTSLDIIYTNIQTTLYSFKSGIIISYHFFVYCISEDMKLIQFIMLSKHDILLK